MKKQMVKCLWGFFLIAVLLLPLASGVPAQSNGSQRFTAEGNFANTSVGPVIINGVTCINLNFDVIRDVKAGVTTLFMRCPTGTINGNRTIRNISGTIPNSSFFFSQDLSFASLDVVVNTNGNNFNNDLIGPISNLQIHANWSAFITGKFVDTLTFEAKSLDPPPADFTFKETFHSNGLHSDCQTSGTVIADGVEVPFVRSGFLDENRSVDRIQTKER
jgi:hypothetical protein